MDTCHIRVWLDEFILDQRLGLKYCLNRIEIEKRYAKVQTCTRSKSPTLAELIYYVGKIASHMCARVNAEDVYGRVVVFFTLQVTDPPWIKQQV